MKLTTINIVAGLKCTLNCDHCCTNSSPNNILELNNNDISLIKSALSNYKFNELRFTGGEPTLYIRLINKVISLTSKESKISIATNGWFAKKNKTKETLSKIDKLSSLLLSHDKFHSYLNEEQIQGLSNYCKNNDIEFNLSVSLQNPKDFSTILGLKSFDGRLIYGKVEQCGRAKKNNVAYQYFEFDDSVLNKKCPNIGSITYYPEKNFSVCCSNLALNSNTDFMYHGSIEEHLNSYFYKNLSSKTFGELLSLYCDKKAFVFHPSHSSECSMCELVHTQI